MFKSLNENLKNLYESKVVSISSFLEQWRFSDLTHIGVNEFGKKRRSLIKKGVEKKKKFYQTGFHKTFVKDSYRTLRF